MAQPQEQKEFDVHDVNQVLQKFAQLRQAIRQMDDDVTGLLYVAVAQLQKEQKEAKEAQAKVVEEKKKVSETKK
jgi:hypothetical protein